MEKNMAYQTREKRIEDAIQIKVPDQVPMLLFLNHYPARHVGGMILQEAYYDIDKWLDVNEKVILEFTPDLYVPPGNTVMAGGPVFEALDHRQIKWPGHGVPLDAPFQFVEGEYMKADEYDEFINDPSDFVVRKFIPRIYGSLAGLSTLPPLSIHALGYGTTSLVGMLALPEVKSAIEALLEAAEASARFTAAFASFEERLNNLGFPPLFGAGGVTLAPFDVVSSVMRGMHGTMLDFFRNPDKLIAAQEKILPVLFDAAKTVCLYSENPRVFIPLHRGSDGFMSLEQFETFYWPGLRDLTIALVEANLTPCILFEGVYDQRLPYLNELPKGKIIAWFDHTDLNKVKETLGDRLCIAGGMPLSLLITGMPEQVKEQTKKLIDTIGKDGGFIMSTDNVMDDAKPELVKIWIETTMEYGIYK
jgi:uroporphyrinogen-III decarboxylase